MQRLATSTPRDCAQQQLEVAVANRSVCAAKSEETRSALQLATCPICLGDLVSNRQEVGALTFSGQRIEPELYHIGCVTMMLCHRGAIRSGANGVPEQVKISWGLSPVTRKPIDGFLRAPLLADRPAWVQFVDWRGQGQVPVSEIAAAIASVTPVDEASFMSFVHSHLEIGNQDVLSAEQIDSVIAPYLERTMKEEGHCARVEASYFFLPTAHSEIEEHHEVKDDPDSVDSIKCVSCLPFRRSRR